VARLKVEYCIPNHISASKTMRTMRYPMQSMVSCRSRLWKIPPTDTRTVHECLIEHFSFHGGGSIPCRNKSAEAGVAYLSVTPPLWSQSWTSGLRGLQPTSGLGPNCSKVGRMGFHTTRKSLSLDFIPPITLFLVSFCSCAPVAIICRQRHSRADHIRLLRTFLNPFLATGQRRAYNPSL